MDTTIYAGTFLHSEGERFRCRSPPLVFHFREIERIKEDKLMAKPYRTPDFKKIYPEAREEVISVLRTTERKMQYQEYDLKRARNIVDPLTGEVVTVPSREDSFERLQKKQYSLQKREAVWRIRSYKSWSLNSYIRQF